MKLDDKIKELAKMRFAAARGELRDRGFVMDLFAFDQKYGHGLARLRALAKLRDRVDQTLTEEDALTSAATDPRWNALIAYLCVSEGFEP